MNIIDNYIIKKYINIVVNTFYRNVSVIKGDKINIKCNVCGDSQKNKHKKRGWFLFYKGNYIFKCFNCGVSPFASSWLKKYHPEYYSSYIKELLYTNRTELCEDKKEETPKKVIDKSDTKFFKPLLKNVDGELEKRAIAVCEKRRIFKDVYENWYISNGGDYKNRLIIPIYNSKNKIAYWQGRALFDNQSPKYLNSKIDTDTAINAQLDCVDKTKPIIIVEGYIDKTFIENCVATMSTNWSDEIQRKLNELNCYYLIDYDYNNKQVSKRKIDLIKSGCQVFNWYKYLKENNISEVREKWDINDLFIFLEMKNRFTFDFFKPYFTDSVFDTIYF